MERLPSAADTDGDNDDDDNETVDYPDESDHESEHDEERPGLPQQVPQQAPVDDFMDDIPFAPFAPPQPTYRMPALKRGTDDLPDLTRTLRSQKAYELDAFLRDAFIEVPLTVLTAVRRIYAPQHPDWSIQELIEAVYQDPRLQPYRTTAGPARKKHRTVYQYPHLGDNVVHMQWKEQLQRLQPGPFVCGVCQDGFTLVDVVQCCAENQHAICRKCLYQYLTITCKQPVLSNVPCVECNMHYPRDSLCAAISPWLLEQLQRRSDDVDRKVALQAGVVAVLTCICGQIGVLLAEDVVDGTAGCSCGLGYCLKCGGGIHPGQVCRGEAVNADTLQWIGQYAKFCPNCGDALQKNGGCNHFTHARSAGGCGHHFCWLCMAPWQSHHGCPLFGNRV